MAPTEGGQVVDVTSLPPRRLVAERGLVLSAGFGGIPSRRRFALASCLPQAVPPLLPLPLPPPGCLAELCHLAVISMVESGDFYYSPLRRAPSRPRFFFTPLPPPPLPSISRCLMLMFASIVDNQPMPVGSPCKLKCHRTVLQASRLVTKKFVLCIVVFDWEF